MRGRIMRIPVRFESVLPLWSETGFSGHFGWTPDFTRVHRRLPATEKSLQETPFILDFSGAGADVLQGLKTLSTGLCCSWFSALLLLGAGTGRQLAANGGRSFTEDKGCVP